VDDDSQPIWLVLDSDAVHHQEELKLAAAELGITLEFVRPGLSDEFTLLDPGMYQIHIAYLGTMGENVAARFPVRASEAISRAKIETTSSTSEEGDRLSD
jgi:hypothetical protein